MATISEIYDSYARMIYFIAYGLLHDEGEALEVLQTVLLRAMEQEYRIAKWTDRQRKAWLYKLARNAAVDRLRRNGRERPWEEAVQAQTQSAMGAEESYMQKYDAERLAAALERLANIYRTPIELCYFAGLSGREAAGILGVKESTLRSRIARGKDMLRDMLREKEDGDGPLG